MKHIIVFSTAVLLSSFILGACSNDDEPRRGNGVFTVNTPMINHMYNTVTGQVMGVSSTHNKLVIDTVNHKATLEFTYNNGTETTVTFDDLKATETWPRFYTLTSAGDASFSGYVNFNQEATMRYRLTTADGIRIISTTPDVFFLNTKSVIEYDDTTKTSVTHNAMYQFTIDASTSKAIVEVMDIVHVKDYKSFINITGNSVPVTVTPNGYTVAGQNISTNARYVFFNDSTGEKWMETNKYPFKTFNATIDLVNDTLNATYMLGNSATVTATGRTFLNYNH
jgi:hypothetical protein